MKIYKYALIRILTVPLELDILCMRPTRSSFYSNMPIEKFETRFDGVS